MVGGFVYVDSITLTQVEQTSNITIYGVSGLSIERFKEIVV